MKWLAILLSLAGCSVSAPPPQSISLPVVLPTAPPSIREVHAHVANASLDEGIFSSDRGLVRLTSDGDAVTGAYTNGVLTCEQRSEVVVCEWFEASGQGHATFHRKPDGRLEGTYGNGASDADIGAWTLVPMTPNDGAGFDGAWDTNWGLSTLKETHGALHVDYPGGQMDCTHKGARALDCTWVEGSLNGTAQFTIEPRVLRGSWTTSAGVTGAWVFVRR